LISVDPRGSPASERRRAAAQATVRYELVETLAESRACRADDQRKLDALRSRLRSLRRGWRATPHDRLYDLMNVFNEDKGQRSTLLGIRRALARLPADLSVRDDLERSRLEACVAWCLDGTTTGEEAFRRAAGRVTGEVRSEWTLARLYMGAGDYAASTLHLRPPTRRAAINVGRNGGFIKRSKEIVNRSVWFALHRSGIDGSIRKISEGVRESVR
jgi:hypothetical protein